MVGMRRRGYVCVREYGVHSNRRYRGIEAHHIRLCLYIRLLRKNITLLTLTYQDNKRK